MNDLRPSMFIREAGTLARQTKTCVAGHKYDQLQVSKDWIYSQPVETQRKYEKGCEVTEGKYWMPCLCPICRGRNRP